MKDAYMVNQQKEFASLLNMIQGNSEPSHQNTDHDCLRLYDENNRHFTMKMILDNEGRPIGYNCIFQYGMNQVNLEYDTINRIWRIAPTDVYGEKEQIFDSVLDDIQPLLQSLPLDQQVQVIIKQYDNYFSEIEPGNNDERYEHKISISSSTFNDENGNKYVNNALIELSLHQPSATIPEDDEQQKDVVDYGFNSLITGSRSKFSGLAPPPVAPRRSRQNSACSTQSSVRYASFVPPPPTAPVRRRRVVESILLQVQRKKKTFEKITTMLKRSESPTMYDLGLEFLRVHDGKFNYREGHTFFLPYRKKTWLLTIKQIKCVDCPVGDTGPRSELILDYKNKFTSVHV